MHLEIDKRHLRSVSLYSRFGGNDQFGILRGVYGINAKTLARSSLYVIMTRIDKTIKGFALDIK